MRTIYIKVPVSERLPEEGFNTVSSGDSWIVAYLIKKQFYDDMYGKHLTFPDYWLEEIELPSSATIKLKAASSSIRNSAKEMQSFEDGSNYILDKIFKRK